MLNRYDWKNIVKRIIIGVGIAFILFNINKCNAYAMVKKDTIGTQPSWSQRSKNGSVNSGSWTAVSFPLSSNLTLNTNFDYIGIQLNNSEYVYNSQLTLNGTLSNAYCDTYGYYDKYYVCPGGDCGNTVTYKQISCKHITTQSGNGLSGTINNQGDVYHYYVLMNATNDKLYPCFFSSEMEEVVFCPTKNDNQPITMTGITFYLSNKASSTLSYYLTLDDIKTYYNENSTEVTNALKDINTSQVQTNTIISNTDTSSSSTSANSGFNNMNSQLTQQVDSLASINTYNSIINNFFTQINNSTCSPISLPMPFVQGKNIVLPCIGTEINNNAPTLWTFWRFMCAGIIGFALWGNMIAFIKGVVDPYNIGANNLPIGGGK